MRSRVRRVEVAAEPLLAGEPYDYADSFEVRLAAPDARSAEWWARASLESATPALVSFIVFAHTRLLRLALAPTGSPAHVIGWEMTHVTDEAVLLRAEGPLIGAAIVGRRRDDRSVTATSYVTYHHPAARFVWAAIAPVHRTVARALLGRAARSTAPGR